MVRQKRATRPPNREPTSAIAATIPLQTPTPSAFDLSQLDPILRADSVASTQRFSPFSNHESIIDT